MKIEIHSQEGAGPIRFGMTTAEVREGVGGEFKSFTKGDSPHPTDIFGKSECFVFYEASGNVEAIEFFEPAKPMLGGVDLLGLSYADLVELVRAQDPDVEIKIEGFTSKKLGIGCYAPDGKDRPDSPAESVIVFRRGYYDD